MAYSKNLKSENLMLDLISYCNEKENPTAVLLKYLFSDPIMAKNRKKIVVQYDSDNKIYSIFSRFDNIYKNVADAGYVFPRGFFVTIEDNNVKTLCAFYPKFENIKEQNWQSLIKETEKVEPGKLCCAIKISGSLMFVAVKVEKNGVLELIFFTKKSLKDSIFTITAKKILLDSLGNRTSEFIQLLHDKNLSLSFEFVSPDPIHGEHGSKVNKPHVVVIACLNNKTNKNMTYAEIEEVFKNFPEINIVEYIEVNATKENIERLKKFYFETRSNLSIKYPDFKKGLYDTFEKEGEEVFKGGNHNYLELYGYDFEGAVVSTKNFSVLFKMKYLGYVGNTMLLRYFFGLILNRERTFKYLIDSVTDASANVVNPESDATVALKSELPEPEVVIIEDKDIEDKVKQLFKNFGYEGEDDYIMYVKGWVKYLQNKQAQLGPKSLYLDELELYKETISK